MAETFVEVVGLKELDRKLKQLEPRLAKKVMRKAVSAAAEPIRRRANQLAPSPAKPIVKNVKRRKSVFVAKIGPKESAFRAIFFEFGTFRRRKEPLVRPRKPKAARMFAAGALGIFPRPFMRPAFDTQKRKTIDVMRQKIASELERLART